MPKHSRVGNIFVRSPAMRGGVAQNSTNSAENLLGGGRASGPDLIDAPSHRGSVNIRDRQISQHREGPSLEGVPPKQHGAFVLPARRLGLDAFKGDAAERPRLGI